MGKVGGRPTFVISDKDGTLIARSGRAAVSCEPTQACWEPEGWSW